MKCDACGKDLTNNGEGGIAMFGISLMRDSDKDQDYLHRIAGSYELDKTYCICFECTLKAFGVPEPVQHHRV